MEDFRGIEVDDKRPAGAAGRPEDAYDAVDVLSRGGDQRHAFRRRNSGEELVFDFSFGREARRGIESTNARPLHQHRVDAWRGRSNQPLEQLRLAPVTADVSAIKETTATCIDDKRISVEGRMADEMRGDGERADFERLSVDKVPRRFRRQRPRHERRSGGEDALRRLAHEDRKSRVGPRQQAPMVAVPMREDDAEKCFVRGSEAVDLRHHRRIVRIAIQRQAAIEQQPTIVMLYFDDRPTDLTCAAMNPNPHGPTHTVPLRQIRPQQTSGS